MLERHVGVLTKVPKLGENISSHINFDRAFAESNLGLPPKQKISVNKFWVRESEIGEEC